MYLCWTKYLTNVVMLDKVWGFHINSPFPHLALVIKTLYLLIFSLPLIFKKTLTCFKMHFNTEIMLLATAIHLDEIDEEDSFTLIIKKVLQMSIQDHMQFTSQWDPCMYPFISQGKSMNTSVYIKK